MEIKEQSKIQLKIPKLLIKLENNKYLTNSKIDLNILLEHMHMKII